MRFKKNLAREYTLFEPRLENVTFKNCEVYYITPQGNRISTLFAGLMK